MKIPVVPSGTSHGVRPGLAPQEHESTRMVALSFDGPSSPSVTLKGLERPHRGQPFGWGFAWYPVQSAAALVVKDATSLGDNAMTKLLREWERFRSTIFVSHLRGAARALAEQDTHPFSRSFGGREWVFAHNGDLDAFDIDEGIETVLPLSSTVIVPVGRTDSERAFCWLLEQCAAVKAYSLADVGWEQLHAWFRYLDDLGTANLMLTDGRDLVVYGDNNGYNRLHHGRLLPPDVPELLRTDDVDIGLTDARDRTRTAIIFSTSPPEETKLKPMHDGQLIVVRRG
ncbi:MAG: class II glutamine amidotransferase, partial [Myxococcota bacterium]